MPRYLQVGVVPEGFNEPLMHGANGFHVLRRHGFNGTPPPGNIAVEAPNQTKVRRCIDKYLQVHQLPEAIVNEDQDSFHNNNRGRFHPEPLIEPDVCLEIVDRPLNEVSVSQPGQVRYEEVELESLGMIVVDLISIPTVQVPDTPVVGVRGQNSHLFSADQLAKFFHQSGLSRSRPAGHSDDEALFAHGAEPSPDCRSDSRIRRQLSMSERVRKNRFLIRVGVRTASSGYLRSKPLTRWEA